MFDLAQYAEADEKPFVQLTGEDGNAFVIIGRCNRAAKQAGWPDAAVGAFAAETMSGDYDNVLRTAMKYFDVH